MMKQISCYGLIIIMSLSFCYCDSINGLKNDTSNEENIEYPTILYPLSDSELDILRTELESLAGNEIKASLNKYGLIDRSGIRIRGSSTIKDKNIAIAKAKYLVFYLKNFTNIIDTSSLIIEEATNTKYGSDFFGDWHVIFKNQSYLGLEVMGTDIMVLINDDCTQITGHYFKYIFVPETNLISEEVAKQAIIDHVIEYGDKRGLLQTFKITKESIHNELAKVVFPLETNNSLELRITWKIPVGRNPTFPDWYVFVDILSGKVIYVWQLFVP